MLTLPAVRQDQGGYSAVPDSLLLLLLLSYVRDNHLRFHLSRCRCLCRCRCSRLLRVLSCEKCILPQFVALAVRCRLLSGVRREGGGRLLCMCVVLQVARCKSLSPCFDAAAATACTLHEFYTKINKKRLAQNVANSAGMLTFLRLDLARNLSMILIIFDF